MPNKIQITCFTDLKGSTDLTDRLGHDAFLPKLANHLQVGKSLAELCGGRYIKNIGDAHMVTFESLEFAIQFVVGMQEFNNPKPSITGLTFGVRIGLFLGVVEPTSDDVFGSGVNQAARVQGKAEPEQVIINKLLFEMIKKVWGSAKASTFFSSLGEQNLKGISDPPQQELFSFDWQSYTRENPDDSLGRLVYEHLQQASVEAVNLSPSDIGIPGLVIWPVVPRNLATAIHRGQAEIIRLLAILGWKVKLLIVDCGGKSYERSYSEHFCECLKKYLETREVGPIECVFTSDLYEPNHDGYVNLQHKFRKLASELTLNDLLAINNKTYKADIQEEIKRAATLDFLEPALATAAVLHLAENEHRKCIIVAGMDERIQWERAIRVLGARTYIGILMNPILNIDSNHQGRQTIDWPIWDSYQSLVREMESTNLAWWVFRMHAYLPGFPTTLIQVGNNPISPTDWENEMDNPPLLQKNELAHLVWKLLDPSLGIV